MFLFAERLEGRALAHRARRSNPPFQLKSCDFSFLISYYRIFLFLGRLEGRALAHGARRSNAPSQLNRLDFSYCMT